MENIIDYKDIYNYSEKELFEEVKINYNNNIMTFEQFLQRYFIENGMDDFLQKLYKRNYFDYQIDYNKFINDLMTDNFPDDFTVDSLRFTEIFYNNNMYLFNNFLMEYNYEINIINKLLDLKYDFWCIESNDKFIKKLIDSNISKKIIDKIRKHKIDTNNKRLKKYNIVSSDSDLSSPESFTSDESASEESSEESSSEEILENCYACNYKKNVEVVCSDCGVKMCNKCSGRPDDNNCACYGNCSKCNQNINRGEYGWACNECDEWYCSDLCRRTSDCDNCQDKIDKDALIEDLEDKIKTLEMKLEEIKKIINKNY